MRRALTQSGWPKPFRQALLACHLAPFILEKGGVEVAKITLIGRWHCSIVLLYTRTAPISSIAEDYKRVRSSKDAHNALKDMEVTPH